ncbi:conserved hypothetical protein [Trichinella spiralis]|uniref:hypothetical protein n=1 Tax=Trichinella spiralis TaxID=6334 RepID=UPI0001EFC5E2|nr:conserved hypothetical protein [Trichinella spiralis]
MLTIFEKTHHHQMTTIFNKSGDDGASNSSRSSNGGGRNCSISSSNSSSSSSRQLLLNALGLETTGLKKAQVCLHKMQPPRQGMLDKSSYKARVSGATGAGWVTKWS